MLKLGPSRAFSALLLAAGLAHGHAMAQGIFTCIDARGQRLTSDRPIPECNDRAQHELRKSGTVLRTVPPSMTADERAAAEETARKAADDKQREDEEKRRNRAMLTRFPDQATHDRERAAALKQGDEAIASAQKRLGDLEERQKKLASETEFYKGDAGKMPAQLKKQIEENLQHIAAQKRFVADRQDEKKRINGKFDEELARLKSLWGQRGGAVAAASASAPKKP